MKTVLVGTGVIRAACGAYSTMYESDCTPAYPAKSPIDFN